MLIFRRGYIHIEVNYQRSFDYGIGTRDPGRVPNGEKGPGCTVVERYSGWIASRPSRKRGLRTPVIIRFCVIKINTVEIQLCSIEVAPPLTDCELLASISEYNVGGLVGQGLGAAGAESGGVRLDGPRPGRGKCTTHNPHPSHTRWVLGSLLVSRRPRLKSVAKVYLWSRHVVFLNNRNVKNHYLDIFYFKLRPSCVLLKYLKVDSISYF